MDDFTPLGAGLAGLPLLSGARTRSVSPENPTGEKGKGAMAIPDPDDPGTLPFSPAASDLGQGWKVSPFVKVAAGETHTVMDVAGPGVIQHIWLVADPAKEVVADIIGGYTGHEETPGMATKRRRCSGSDRSAARGPHDPGDRGQARSTSEPGQPEACSPARPAAARRTTRRPFTTCMPRSAN